MSLLTVQKPGFFYTLELPEQQTVNELGFEQAERHPAVTVHLFVACEPGTRHHRAIENALELLRTLLEYGVSDARVLRVILQATGHQVIGSSAAQGASANEASVRHES